MVTIRCPQCGMQNHPDDIGFPRCGQCHEDLVRCPDCKSFEEQRCAHPQMQARFTADGEAAKTCPAFASRYAERDSRFIANLPAPLWVSFSLLLVILGLSLLAWGIDPAGRYFFGDRLQLSLAVPAKVPVNTPFQVRLRVTNPLDQPSTRLYIEIGEEFLANATAGEPTPRPEHIVRLRSQHRELLGYDPLPADGQRDFLLPFMLLQQRNTPLVVRLYSPINHLCKEVHTTIAAQELPATGNRKGGQL